MVSKRTLEEETSFSSNLERIVASALLLLSYSPSKEDNKSCSPSESYECFGFSSAKSSDESSEASFGGESFVSPVAYVPRLTELNLNLKVVRKKRSKMKTIWISNDKKLPPIKPISTCLTASSDCVSEITTADTLSSFSSSSSSQSYSSQVDAADRQRKPVIYGHIGNQAKAILKVLSNGNASEVRIRQLLGDSPTTSKALRMLLKHKEVKRHGGGGRNDPYIYMIA